MIRAALPLALIATAGCQYDKAPETAPAPPSGKCVAGGLAALTGKTRSEATAAEALRLSGATKLRWIAPGMAVTMDYREDRLNLEIDAQGKIVRANCG
jgi:hypothetical protein